MDTQRSRVTVFAPTGHADLAVPNTVPLALLLPFLFEELKIKSRSSAESWEITGVDGRPISRDMSLRDADVRDGDLLFVRRPDAADGRQYDDVVEVICEEGAQTTWLPRYTTIAAMTFGIITMLMAIVGLTLNLEPPPRALIGASAAAILGMGAFAATRHADTRPGAPVAVVLAACWAAVAGNALTGGTFDGIGVLAAAVAFGAVCVLGGLGLGMSDSLVYPATAFSVLAAVGGAVLLTTDRLQLAAAIVAAAGIVAIVIAPATALRLSGVTDLDDSQDHDVAVPIDVARKTVRGATQALSGLVAGITAATMGAVVILSRSTDATAYALAVGVVALTLIRAATFRDRWQVGTLIGGGLCGLIAVTIAIPWRDRVILGALTGVIVACFLTAVAVTLRLHTYRLRQLGALIETALMIAVMPAVLGIGGVYGAVLGLWG